MSASMRPHTGPAMMCASSTTRQPLRGPPAISASLPVRLALGEKGFEAFAEVLAGVAEDDEVFVVDLGRGGGQPAQRLLGRAQGERRLSRQQRSQLQGALLDGRSEEHTSELQSLMRISYAVFCLKKKKRNKPRQKNTKPANLSYISCYTIT